MIGGRCVLRRCWIVAATGAEAFTATGLLVVIATALLVSQVGLSLSLGAFLAGVLLADGEFRHGSRLTSSRSAMCCSAFSSSPWECRPIWAWFAKCRSL